MFGFRRRDNQGKGDAAAETVSVALIGEGYRRSYVKRLLGGRVEITAELASDRRAHLLAELSPSVVVFDCASGGVNPLLSLPRLSKLGGSPRVVALTDGAIADGPGTAALHSLGADAVADIRDRRAVTEAILPNGAEPPGHRRHAPATV